MPNEIPCPIDGCEGKLEMSSKIYFDITGTADDDTITIDDITLSDLNDYVRMPVGSDVACNLEGELYIGCDHCGHEFTDVKFSDEFRKRINGQSQRTHPTGENV